MSELTFAGNSRVFLENMRENNIDGQREFFRLGKPVFESEDLVDYLYDIFIPLIVKGWQDVGRTTTIIDIGEAYLNGFYLPCVDRIVLSGQIDRVNDTLPDKAGLVIKAGCGDISVASARMAVLPRGYAAPTRGVTYCITIMYSERDDDKRNVTRVLGNGDSLKTMSHYVIVKDTGDVIPAIELSGNKNGNSHAIFCQVACISINAWADAAPNVWRVRTSEDSALAPIILGCGEEHIKSLFYARRGPTSVSGRKRPILHWVKAHERRLREGTDIDISKHLRGVWEFDMEGFHFEITSPTKLPLRGKSP